MLCTISAPVCALTALVISARVSREPTASLTLISSWSVRARSSSLMTPFGKAFAGDGDHRLQFMADRAQLFDVLICFLAHSCSKVQCRACAGAGYSTQGVPGKKPKTQ